MVQFRKRGQDRFHVALIEIGEPVQRPFVPGGEHFVGDRANMLLVATELLRTVFQIRPPIRERLTVGRTAETRPDAQPVHVVRMGRQDRGRTVLEQDQVRDALNRKVARHALTIGRNSSAVLKPALCRMWANVEGS